MLLSMTGFGKSVCMLQNHSIEIQIKTLNAKSAEINVKLPNFLKEKEIEIRTLLSELLQRGKIDISINAEKSNNVNTFTINETIAKNYILQIKNLSKTLSIPEPENYFPVLFQFPDIIEDVSIKTISSEEWKAFYKHLLIAIQEVVKYRKQEGKVLEKDIFKRILFIQSCISQIQPLEKNRKKKTEDKLRSEFSEKVKSMKIDESRLEQELIYYFEKMDISEEIVRTDFHCTFFINTLKAGEANGKKLLFISQEILRELNTIGVKAGDSEIQKLAIEMKDELEKIREQLNNIL